MFEEFDCIDKVLSRTIKKESENKTDMENDNNDYELKRQILLKTADKCTTQEEATKLLNSVDTLRSSTETTKNSKLTLDTILTELSGVSNVSGRIIIATTNHPEKIDKALIRPGRFDIIAHLSYLTNTEANELAYKIFQKSCLNGCSNPNLIDIGNRNITPAEFINIAIMHKTYEETCNYFNANKVNSIEYISIST